jgi:signal transduction histidine kinase
MKSRPLKEFLLISWAIPLVLTIFGGSLLAIGLSYADYSHYLRSERERLGQIATGISRRVAAEILLKSHGTLGPVVEQLKSEYGLSALEITEEPKALGAISFHLPIRETGGAQILSLEKEARRFGSFVNIRHFLLALLPTVGLALFGFLLQRWYLRRHLIEPVEALAETSVGNRPLDESWPKEIQEIAEKLASSFSDREQAVFGLVARGIIHDIRTHIHSIHTATQLSEMPSAEAAQKLLRLERLLAACQRNIPKIKSIVDLSLDTSREISLQPRQYDISQTVKQAIASIEELAKAKGVTISQEFSGDLSVACDVVQLERVFTNVIKNAVEAAEDKNAPRAVSVRGGRFSSSVRISIEDSGHGIKDRAAVFRPLKSTKIHGIGLGLFVSKKIIEAHGGRIFPEESEMGGAKFTVEIPVSEVRHDL